MEFYVQVYFAIFPIHPSLKKRVRRVTYILFIGTGIAQLPTSGNVTI